MKPKTAKEWLETTVTWCIRKDGECKGFVDGPLGFSKDEALKLAAEKLGVPVASLTAERVLHD